MKTLIPFFLIFLITAMGCASTETATDSASSQTEMKQADQQPKGSVSDDKDYYRDLSDYLKQIPGVNVSQNTVTIRGINSFSSGNEPLFVIDGQPVGSSYAQVKEMVNVREIDHVRALKGPDASVYGIRGSNGVILIVTKR